MMSISYIIQNHIIVAFSALFILLFLRLLIWLFKEFRTLSQTHSYLVFWSHEESHGDHLLGYGLGDPLSPSRSKFSIFLSFLSGFRFFVLLSMIGSDEVRAIAYGESPLTVTSSTHLRLIALAILRLYTDRKVGLIGKNFMRIRLIYLISKINSQ